MGEYLATIEKLSWTIKYAEESLKPESRPTNFLMLHKRNKVLYEPLGIVAAITSWNYPLHNIMHPIFAALATGNAIVLKPSERVACSSDYFVSIVRQAIRAAIPQRPGLADVVQLINCWPAEAQYLTKHPLLNHLTFIGSYDIGRTVALSAAENLTQVCLELGGKDPAIVLDNTPEDDLGRIASILTRGVFQAAGQNCIGIERIIIQPCHLGKLLKMLEARVRALEVGDPLDPSSQDEIDVGACISDERFDELEMLVKKAWEMGAHIHCGGHRYRHPRYPNGYYFAPTLLSRVTPEMAIAKTELFSPVMLVFHEKAASTLDQVIDLANDTDYALGASVFGRPGSYEMRKVVKDVRAGMICENDFASAYLCSLPFGGSPAAGRSGGSGYGRFNGPEGLRSLCNVKSYNYDRCGSLSKTSIPTRLDFRSSKEHDRVRGAEQKRFAFVGGMTAFAFGLNVVERVRGLWQMLINA
ncbi:MAG: hypothetical protein Q9162_001252 [Coniocarpon cinnabarinum]